MSTGIIVQARMGSKRLPGKVLYPVAGKPMLQYLLERLEHCGGVDKVVVATSSDQSDDPIFEFCQQYGAACYRGSLLNVAARFKELLDIYQFDTFVRISGDSPFLDAKLIELGLEIFCRDNFDLVTNVMPRSYPKGQSVEIVRGIAFKAAYPLMQTEEELEHVTKYFYSHRADFYIFNFAAPQAYGDIQLSVDNRQDMELFAAIVGMMNRPHWQYGLEDVLGLYRQATQSTVRIEA